MLLLKISDRVSRLSHTKITEKRTFSALWELKATSPQEARPLYCPLNTGTSVIQD